MAEPTKPEKKKTPKGGRKGGTLFPKINLQKALEYGKKLVAKTHVASQPEDEILPGVFGNSGPEGKVRASALKQFGLMQGDAKAYEASQLAKDIDAALPDERSALLQRAVLASKLFNRIFDTFHGDTVSRAQIAKRAKELEVHPTSADECAQLFFDSAITAGLGTPSGENVQLINVSAVAATTTAAPAPAANGQDDEEFEGQVEEPEREHKAEESEIKSPDANKGGGQPRDQSSAVPSADVRVNLTVDSSSDPDKLEKQLKLLKQFGLLRS
ncbi:MAG: hypothetical protein WCA13_02660 [Terriglobales bacterium]